MEKTISSQQELIKILTSVLAANQHQQMQTISSQEEFISTLQVSLNESKLSPAAKPKNNDVQKILHRACFLCFVQFFIKSASIGLSEPKH